MPYLAVGGVGPWAWAGVAGRWARRHAAPAVVGRFIIFSRLGLFWRFGALGFAGHDGRTKPGSPQTPFFERKIAKNFIAKIFLAILKNKLMTVLLLYVSGQIPNF